MKAIQLLVDSSLPEDLRDPTRTYDKSSVDQLMAQIARSHPDQYEKLSKKISDIGRKASYIQGETIRLDDLRPVLDRKTLFAQMDAEVEEARKNAVSTRDFESARLEIWSRYNDLMEKETSRQALKNRNNLAFAVVSGARGKAPQIKAMITSPGLFSDDKGEVVPLFVRHSFGDGLRPAEYLASTFGGRSTVISTKSSTAKGGDFSKIAVQAASPLVVTTKDCGVYNGIDIPVDDPSLRGRVLAFDSGDVKAGTVLDRQALDHLRSQKVNDVVARSVLTCQAPEGICAKCAGTWAGKFPTIGSALGITKTQCLAERTFVAMADGAHKPIESIRVGDVVVGVSMDGTLSPANVVNVFNNGKRRCWSYLFGGENMRTRKLVSTSEHKILQSDMENPLKRRVSPVADISKTTGAACTPLAFSLDSGFEMGVAGMRNLRLMTLDKIPAPINTYDIEIDNETHLFLLANGLVVSNSVGEPVTQMALNQKHTSGMAAGKKEFSGLEAIAQFTTSPETFPQRAAVAEEDGEIEKIEDAPQGGKYIKIGEKSHYVLPGYELLKRVGEKVEAGDQLSDGVVDPEDVIRLKGIGEGRMYYTERFGQLLKDSGVGADRRGVEMLARSAVNHVTIDDPDGVGDYLPDDIANYNRVAATYVAPATAKKVPPKDAVGKYLQAPALHYTIGTRVTPSVAKKLSKFDSVVVDDSPPGFSPYMSSLRTASQSGDDWMSKLHTSYLRKNLSESAVRGEDATYRDNTHFAGPLAYGKDFGKNIETEGKF